VYEYSARVVNVVDGDTLDLDVDVGFRHRMIDRFRLYGINAYEVRGAAERRKGRAAKAALIDLIGGSAVLLRTHEDSRGKYGRWLADIYLEGMGEPTVFVSGRRCQHVNEWLVDQGHAIRVEY